MKLDIYNKLGTFICMSEDIGHLIDKQGIIEKGSALTKLLKHYGMDGLTISQETYDNRSKDDPVLKTVTYKYLNMKETYIPQNHYKTSTNIRLQLDIMFVNRLNESDIREVIKLLVKPHTYRKMELDLRRSFRNGCCYFYEGYEG